MDGLASLTWPTPREPSPPRAKVLAPGQPLSERLPTIERNSYGRVSLTGSALGLGVTRLTGGLFFAPAFLTDEIQDLLNQHPHSVRCHL